MGAAALAEAAAANGPQTGMAVPVTIVGREHLHHDEIHDDTTSRSYENHLAIDLLPTRTASKLIAKAATSERRCAALQVKGKVYKRGENGERKRGARNIGT